MAKKGKPPGVPASAAVPDLVTHHPNPLAALLPLVDRMTEFLDNPKLTEQEQQDLGFLGTIIEGVFVLSGEDPDRAMKGQVFLTEFAAGQSKGAFGGLANPVEIAEFTSVLAKRADASIRARVERLMEELGNGSPDPLIAARQERHLRGQIEVLGLLSEKLNGAQRQAYASADAYLRSETEAVMGAFSLATSATSRNEERHAISGVRNSAAEIGQWSKRLENAKAGRTVLVPPADDAPEPPYLPPPRQIRVPETPGKKKLVEGVDCSWTHGFSLSRCSGEDTGKPANPGHGLPPAPAKHEDSGRSR